MGNLMEQAEYSVTCMPTLCTLGFYLRRSGIDLSPNFPPVFWAGHRSSVRFAGAHKEVAFIPVIHPAGIQAPVASD